ncbi:hypothetical protein [Solidesulfovibrio sp.]|uniref:hypothetical protein n=1 Tax=Solidesulfovibrio sp. TaxID=2910990 RepID=UPI00262D30F1|nr:hypothetical protein [Solidesulfovibrio sp.]
MLDEQQQDNFWDTYQTKAEDRIIRDAEHSLVDAGIVPPPPDPFQTWAQSPEGQDVAAKVEEQKAKLSVFQQSFNKTAEEPAMPKPTEAGNIDLNNRPVIKNADGTISTVRSMSFNEGNGEILIPTTAEDGSRILSDDEAIQQYHQTGKHLGKFSTPEDATAYAQQLHEKQAQQYGQDESGQAGVPDTTATAAPAGKTLPQPSPISFPGGKAPVWLRNNNPGNIRASSTSFQSYGTMEEGLSAQKDLLLRYQDKHGLNTVTGIVSRYAPPNENKTQEYINTVSKDMGVSPDQPLDLHDPNTLFALQKSMVRVETGRKAALTASNDQELADVLKVPGYSGGSNGTGGIPGFGQAPVVQARNQRTPLEATGDIFSEAWQRTKDYGSKALGNTYAGMAGFFRTLDDLSSDVAAATGTDKGGVFQALMEQSDYWAKHFLGQVKYDDYMTNVVGGILGSGPGMMEFAMGPAFAGLKGYTEGGLPTAAKSAATWGIMKGILAATNALPMALRAPTTGAAFSGQALAEGVTAPGQLAEAFGVGMGMGIATPQTRTPWNQRLPGVDYDAMSDANIMNLHRAMMNGETDQATYEVAKRLVKDIPGLSDRVQVEVVPALMLASKELSSQYGISGEGKIVGSHTPNQEVEPGVFRDLVKLYDGHMPAVDLLHEIGGHNIVERLLPQFPQVEQELRQFWKDSGAEARGVDFAEFGADEVARSYLSQGLFMGQGETPWGEFVGRVKGVFDRTLDRLGVLPESRAPQNFDQLVQQALQEGRTFKGIGAPGPREQDRVRPVSESKNWEEIGRWGFGDKDVPFEVQDKLQSIEPDVIDNNLPPPLKAKSLGINYSKINSEEDIAGLINKVETVLAPDIDAARRYERSHDTTAQAASDLGMTEADLLARMRGEGWNAEKTYAARVILNASAEDLMRRARDIKGGDNSDASLLAFRRRMEVHAALQAHVAGLRAEAGRALNQWKMLASTQFLDPALMNQLTGEDMAKLTDQAGGRRLIEEAANSLVDAAQQGPVPMHKVDTLVHNVRQRTFGDWFLAYRYMCMLSSPKTHVANMMGNMLVAGMAIPERAVASLIGKGFKTARDTTGLPWGWLSEGDGDVSVLEAKAMAFALVQNQTDALKLAWEAMKTGESKFGGQQKQDYAPMFGQGAPGWIGKNIPESWNKAADAIWTGLGIPGRALGAEDEYFKFLGYRQGLAGLAFRQAAIEGRQGEDITARAKELMDAPPADMAKAALDFARVQTFTQDMGSTMSALNRFRNSNLFLKLLMPFVSTPYNILQYSLDRTPIAFIKKSFWDDFQSGGAKRDLALARVALGSSIMGLAVMANASGLITGDGPSEPKEREAWRRVYQPNSVKVGDQWVAYDRTEPVGTLFSMAANARMIIQEWDQVGQERDLPTLFTALALATAKTITSKTWLQGVADAMNAVTFPESKGPRMLQGFASSFVPSILRDVVVETDPEVKAVWSWVDAMKSRIPGLSSSLPPKRDIWGDPYQVHAAGEGLYLGWLSPLKVQTGDVSEIDKELLRLEWGPSIPRRTQSFQGVPLELTPQEYDRFIELSTQVMRNPGDDGVGRTMKADLEHIIRTRAYKQLDDEQKKMTIQREIQVYRQAAQIRLMKENPRLQALMTLGLREKGRNQ